MNDAAYADDSDEQIEEFDSDDDESGYQSPPINTVSAPRPIINKNVAKFRPPQANTLKLPKTSPIQFKPKSADKKITINIKTPMIIDAPQVQPKSPEPKSPEPESPKPKLEDIAGEKKDVEEETPQDKQSQSNETTDPEYAKHLTYEGSLCIYTEPGTGRQLIWNTDQNAWVQRTEENSARVDEIMDVSDNAAGSVGDTCRPRIPRNDEDAKGIENESDENETTTKGPKAAEPGGIYGFEGDTHTYTDPNDGSVYMWDREKNAWFPKVDDEFLARYQLSYGFTDPAAAEANVAAEPVKIETKAEKEARKAEAKRKAQEPSTWFEVDEAHNTAVYITGLPLDINMEELTGIVTKFGLLARDDKAKDKIKLYRDKDGQPKGDALVTYIKVESVNLALHLLDGSQIRGNTLSVQRAKFQMKGTYDPALKPKRKKKDKDRAKKIHEKLFDWRPEPMRGEPQKCERVVVIKNLFSPEDFDKEVTLLLEYQQDLRAECSKCGDVKKVVLYDRHPEGVAQVTFKEPAEAQACIQLLNGRWFAQKQLSAEIWDGKTKYKIAETDAEIEERIAKWDKFLDDEDDKKEAAKKKAAEDSEAERKNV